MEVGVIKAAVAAKAQVMTFEQALIVAVGGLATAVGMLFKYLQSVRKEHLQDLRESTKREAEINAKYEARVAELERKLYAGWNTRDEKDDRNN